MSFSNSELTSFRKLAGLIEQVEEPHTPLVERQKAAEKKRELKAQGKLTPSADWKTLTRSGPVWKKKEYGDNPDAEATHYARKADKLRSDIPGHHRRASELQNMGWRTHTLTPIKTSDGRDDETAMAYRKGKIGAKLGVARDAELLAIGRKHGAASEIDAQNQEREGVARPTRNQKKHGIRRKLELNPNYRSDRKIQSTEKRESIGSLAAEGATLLEDPKWHRPDMSKEGPEYGEITRTGASLKLKSKDLHAAVKKARLRPLSDKHWSTMNNTESWKANKRDADYYAKKYKRDIKRIYKGYKTGEKMPAPIVLHRPGKKPYLVGGNTRLLAASAMGIRPKVLHVRMKK